MLKCEARRTSTSKQIKPVASGGIVFTKLGWLMSFAVDEPEKQSPKLGARARIGRIKHDLRQLRNGRALHVANNIS